MSARPARIQALIDTRDGSLFDGGTQPKGGVPLHPDSIAEGLALAGAQRELAGILRAEAMADLAAWIAAADRHGMPRAAIARTAGVSRTTVYAVLDGGGGRGRPG